MNVFTVLIPCATSPPPPLFRFGPHPDETTPPSQTESGSGGGGSSSGNKHRVSKSSRSRNSASAISPPASALARPLSTNLQQQPAGETAVARPNPRQSLQPLAFQGGGGGSNAFSPGGRNLLVGNGDTTISARELDDGRERGRSRIKNRGTIATSAPAEAAARAAAASFAPPSARERKRQSQQVGGVYTCSFQFPWLLDRGGGVYSVCAWS